MTAPPPPFHILRSHATALSTLSFNPTNTVLYAGDQDGFISITDLRTRRTVCHWRAHGNGILGLQERNGRLISQGRDNKIHMYEPQPLARGSTLVGLAGSSRPHPVVSQSMDTNSLNFCRFSIVPIPSGPDTGKGKGREAEALMAVPNLTSSEHIDIYHLPSMKRVHASINFQGKPVSKAIGGSERTGIVMSLHLAFIDEHRLRLVAGFEDGRVDVYACDNTSSGESTTGRPWETSWDRRLQAEPRLWEKLWTAKPYEEAVMAMAVTPDLSCAFTVSSDHRIFRYDLAPLTGPVSEGVVVVSDEAAKQQIKPFSMGRLGHASMAISASGAVVAVGGWDGKIRLFSATTLKPLGALATHKETVHCLAFASAPTDVGDELEADEASTLDIGGGSEDDDSDDDANNEMGVAPRTRWLASGGKDKRIALWGLMDFAGG